MSRNLSVLFQAQSIAVVGASGTPGKTGYTILKNIIDAGFPGPVYPINPKAGELLGRKAYHSLEEIGAPVDLAIFTIPAPALPGAMEEAGAAGVKGAVVITGGLSEVGNTELERRVLDTAAVHGIRVIGPNCQGITSPHYGICASWPLAVGRGPIAVISQSGTIGAAVAGWLIREGIGVSATVSLGNKSDVDECDLLEYFAQDAATKAIALNIEGVRSGQRFIDTCRRVAATKPIIVLKPGRSEKGKQAAASHTKSVAGDARVFSAVCVKAGLIQADSTEGFYDAVKAFALSCPIRGNEIRMMTSSGGSGILAVDSAEDMGLDVPPLTEAEKQRLKEALPSHCVLRNPLDLTGDTDAGRYVTAAQALDPGHTGVLLLIFGDPIPGAAEAALKIKAATGQDIVCCYIGGGDVEIAETHALQRLGFPVYPTPERAVAAINALYRYGRVIRQEGTA